MVIFLALKKMAKPQKRDGNDLDIMKEFKELMRNPFEKLEKHTMHRIPKMAEPHTLPSFVTRQFPEGTKPKNEGGSQEPKYPRYHDI